MDKKKYTVLYVEDYQVIQTMYADALAEHGFEVTTATNGREALERAGEQKYDVIVTDILLPDVTGLEFLREFTKNHSASNIVVLTDFDKPEMIEEVKGLGVKHYWIKVDNEPYQLIERLKKLLETNNS